jgi:hypothetical protein
MTSPDCKYFIKKNYGNEACKQQSLIGSKLTELSNTTQEMQAEKNKKLEFLLELNSREGRRQQ